jgi:hypothetical protein
MRTGQKLVLGCGVITMLLGLLHFVVVFTADFYTAKPKDRMSSVVGTFILVDVLFPALILTGAFLHAVKQNIAGIVLLGIGSTLAFCYCLLIGFVIIASWYYPTHLALITLAPSAMALVTTFLAAVLPTRQDSQ